MKHKKSVLKILSANSECFRVSAGIAPNVKGFATVLEFKNQMFMKSTKELFMQYCLECGMDEDDIKACSWSKAGMIDFADWLLSQNIAKPIVSGSACLHEWDEGSHNVHKCKKCGKYNC